ncbi:F-box/kelch-repeat protein SKIP4 [Sesamum indicum]|uniref:F-box/kelch-repeat protein SKIP4 n=1 Tax=Sesamum indicum TaxID=4182 RepID=A0A6I9TXS3_SESIN|nr:F-box/kelch-repeat protein SKIP4 [Sesamum indicum]XP_011092121.1 F-box/kelch-repeat protein SKIP4 [Sesamum indicum]XP_020552325.1 F-box/kelch-repeat protein SKIP4 [Sesamum indicum]
MASMESGSWTLNPQEQPQVRDSTKIGIEGLTELEKPALIPGLPDDIAFSCLARVPRKYHPVLNCVSKRWRELICGEEWYLYRLNHHLEETWVYALCRDKFEQLCMFVLDPNQLKKGWKRIHGLPGCCLKRKGVGFEVLGKKVYLFGGCGWIEDATDDVYCYDATMSTWTRAGSLSTPRCFFAYEALDGKIYAIGGLGSTLSDPHSWDIYDSHTNCWSSHVDPNVIPDIEDSIVLDGKIYIRCGISAVSSHVYAVVYEPSSGTWQHADTDVACGWRGPAVVIDGVLYVLDQTSGVRLMMWQKEAREWMAIRRLSTHLIIPPCRLVAIGKKIFVVGKGLSTVMFDVESAGCVDGVLVSSSLKLTSDDEVISCKTLAV